MFKKVFAIILAVIMIFAFAGCDLEAILGETVPATETSTEPAVPITFIADFYDNHGAPWLSVEGDSFDIKPNKVKEYYYSTDGTWTYNYALSSIVSIYVDNKRIESCGSTVIFYDTRLEKLEIDIPEEVDLSGETGDETINAPNDISWSDAWSLNWWWDTKELNNGKSSSRVVIIQSQEGDPICMFRGNDVSWDVPKNLPKTTELNIDGKQVFIHRANFAIVDLSVFE